MRIAARVTRGIWVSVPFTIMGFMTGGIIVAILLFLFSFFIWPIFVVDFLKEENGKTLLKICGVGYLLVGLYGVFFEPMGKLTSTGYVSTGWYFISILSLIVCVAYFVVGFGVLEKETVSSHTSLMPFDEMWEQYIMPLSGQTITNDGLTNTIINVDWNGIQRTTSTGNMGKIPIEDFKYAYNQLVLNGQVERTLINQHANRCSSGIVLVLSQVPFIEVQNKPRKMLYVK